MRSAGPREDNIFLRNTSEYAPSRTAIYDRCCATGLSANDVKNLMGAEKHPQRVSDYAERNNENDGAAKNRLLSGLNLGLIGHGVSVARLRWRP